MSSEDTKMAPLKVAVVGGGLCGLSVAIVLQKAGLDVNLYEAAAKFGEIGAGVGIAIGPNAIRALQRMGLLDAIIEHIKPELPDPRPFLFISGVDHEVYYDYPYRKEDSGLGIHRAVFLDALVHLLEPTRAHFNKRCVGARQLPDGQMQITFADGTTAEADVLLGADGIRSNVRTFVIGADRTGDCDEKDEIAEVVRVAYTNTIAYRGLVPVEHAKQNGVDIDLTKRPHCIVGKDKHIIVFPIKDNTIINVVAFVTDLSKALPLGNGYNSNHITRHSPSTGSESDSDSDSSPITPTMLFPENNIGSAFLSPAVSTHEWVTPRSTPELLSHFSDFSPSIRALLSCISAPSAWAIHACAPPLSTYVRGKVALLGDAAHSMPPHLGAGAGQAIEDARAMGRLLSHPKVRRDNVEAVLSAYSALRRPRANAVLAGSLRSGEIYELRGPHAREVGASGIAKDLEGNWLFVWDYDVDVAIDGMIEELERRSIL